MCDEPNRKPSNRPLPHVNLTPPTDGEGKVTWEGGLSAVTVKFRDGIVTSVEHGEAKRGLRRWVTTYSP